ncbi:MAG: hypothetical protein LBI99_10615 [Propionibacteriaceae bacterium]|jgi:hypothetical protein|nr:hypothetical protein [Propionibacteriaceae bacterium]
MSEHWVYVACTCCRDDLTTEPPVPRAKIKYDKYGNIMQKRSKTPEDDSEKFWDWRYEGACSHRNMRVVDEIWDARDWRAGGEAGEIIASGRFPYLEQVLDNSDSFNYAEVLAAPESAAVALKDLDAFSQLTPHGTTRVVLDAEGDIAVRPVDYAQLPAPGFKPLNDVYENRESDGRWDASPDKLDRLIEIGLEGTEFVVRNHPNHEELLRAKRIRQTVDTSDYTSWSIWGLVWVVLENADTHKSVAGYSQGIRKGSYNAVLEAIRRGTFLEAASAAEVPRVWTDDLWPLRFLRELLEASVKTGNPLIGYYSGGSFGFEQ